MQPLSSSFKVLFVSVLLIACYGTALNAQILYGSVNVGNQQYIYKFNLNTCDFCAVTPSSANIGGFDIVILNDGTILNISTSPGLARLEVPPSVQLIWQAGNPQGYTCGELAANGLVYLGGDFGLGTYNPMNNTVTYLGDWPPGFGNVGDLYFVNGILYGSMSTGGQFYLVEINVNDPGQSVIIGPLPIVPSGSTNGATGGIWNGNPGFFYNNFLTDIMFYNPADDSNTLICDFNSSNFVITGLSFAPPGVPEYDCILNCTTDAGVLPTGGPYDLCANETLTFPAATQTDLEPDDVLQYILFTNLSDTAGSIVATGSSPSFAFGAPLQTGVTYYIAAMAGDELPNGNVDLDDPCLDFSNALQVVWRPLPTVVLSVANTEVCAGGCLAIQAAFTGTPPYTLEVATPFGPNQTFTFGSNSGSFQVCPPAGTPPGSVSVHAVGLVDANCTCE